MSEADRTEASGVAGSDVALLIGFSFLAIHLREVVIAVWLGFNEGIRVALNALAGTVSRGIAMELAFLFVVGVVITIVAGRRRSIGRDFDLACVAFIPFIAVKVVATLGMKLAGVRATAGVNDGVGVLAYGWALVVVALAVKQTRSRPDSRDVAELGPE